MAQKASRLPRLLLHVHQASPPSSAVTMLANILNLKMDYKELDVLKLEHRTVEFKKMNPIGMFPVLQDNHFIVSESHSIMKYLLSKYGGDNEERLYPSDIDTRSKIDTCLFFDAGVIFIRLKTIAIPTLFNGYPGPTPEQLADIDDAYSVLEAYLQNSKYIAANHLTIADLSLGSTTTAIQGIHKLDANKFPRTAKWLALICNESFFKDINFPSAALFTETLNTFWEKNKNQI